MQEGVAGMRGHARVIQRLLGHLPVQLDAVNQSLGAHHYKGTCVGNGMYTTHGTLVYGCIF